MIEMSAAAVPALAQPGAILAAAPAPASSEGAQIADFSVVLAGAALVTQMPEPTAAPEPEPPTPAPILPELPAAPAKSTRNTGIPGKETGKMLPGGKLPVTRDAALAAKAPRAVVTGEAQDEQAPTQDPAPADNATPDAPDQTVAAAPTEVVVQQTTSAPQEPAVSFQSPPATSEPTRSTDVIARQAMPSPPAVNAIPADPRTSAPAADSVASAVVADVRPSATNTPAAMSSDTPAVLANNAPAVPLGNAPVVRAKDAPAPPEAAALDGTTIAIGAAAVVTQTAAVASTPEVTAPIGAPAPLLSTKAALMANSAVNLTQPAVTPPALAQTARPSVAVISEDVPASVPATAAPMTRAPVENDMAPQLATLAALPVTLLVPAGANATLQPASFAIVAPVLPAKGGAVQPQAADDLTITAPMPSVSALTQGKAAIEVEAAATAPAAHSTRDAAVAAAPLTAQPSRQAVTAPVAVAAAALTATIAAAPPMTAAPETANQQAAAVAPVQSEPRAEPATAPGAVLAMTEPVEHKRALPVAATDAPANVSRPEPVSIVTGNDMRTAAIFAAPATPATATTPTQDIAALVDRITEARAAAAPQTIRAALVHEDFGSVSLNLRTEASHIHVTLGSADPGFAPAVQAAAAANLAGNGNDDAQNRREAPAPQSNAQHQDATRNDTSSQQQAQRDRANAGERQPTRQAPARQPTSSGERAATAATPQLRSGIYA
jgi:Meckel syndrome type 1 protein